MVMVKVKEVAEGIFHLEGGQKATHLRDIMVCYLVQGHRMALIEPGTTSHAPLIEEGLRQLQLKATDLAYIIPTHIHIDHGGGAGYWAQKLPRVQIVLHPQGVSHMLNPTQLTASTKLAFGEDFESKYGPILPVPEGQVHEAREGEVLDLGGRELRVIFSPGHAPHHLALLDSRSQGLFCGEALGFRRDDTGIPFPAASPPAFDMEQYLATAEMLRGLKPAILFYSHDGIGQDVPYLIDQVQLHTRAIGALLEPAVRAGEGAQRLGQRFKEYVRSVMGQTTDYDPTLVVAGFMLYFQRKAEKK